MATADQFALKPARQVANEFDFRCWCGGVNTVCCCCNSGGKSFSSRQRRRHAPSRWSRHPAIEFTSAGLRIKFVAQGRRNDRISRCSTSDYPWRGLARIPTTGVWTGRQARRQDDRGRRCGRSAGGIILRRQKKFGLPNSPPWRRSMPFGTRANIPRSKSCARAQGLSTYGPSRAC